MSVLLCSAIYSADQSLDWARVQNRKRTSTGTGKVAVSNAVGWAVRNSDAGGTSSYLASHQPYQSSQRRPRARIKLVAPRTREKQSKRRTKQRYVKKITATFQVGCFISLSTIL